MDEKSLKQFVENDQLWAKFVDERFAKLNKGHTGKLTHTELEPAISRVGKALGLPPMGSDPETDHIYTEVRTTPLSTTFLTSQLVGATPIISSGLTPSAYVDTQFADVRRVRSGRGRDYEADFFDCDARHSVRVG